MEVEMTVISRQIQLDSSIDSVRAHGDPTWLVGWVACCSPCFECSSFHCQIGVRSSFRKETDDGLFGGSNLTLWNQIDAWRSSSAG